MAIGGLIIVILGIMFGPPLVLFIAGLSQRKQNQKKAKVLFILAAVYVLIGGGICATILTS